MKTKNNLILAIIVVCLFLIILFISSSPIREFYRIYEYPEHVNYTFNQPGYEISKKTVVIIADNKSTEVFDLIAPFYLFNATQKTNVYIIAEDKSPVYVYKGFFLLPHFSFQEFENTEIKPDAIIIPNLSAMDSKSQNPVIIKWIKKNYTDSTNVLSVCAGALTAAATGLYDNQPITTHASDFDATKKQYPGPIWVSNVSVTNSENLYSTAGVSNAVEGSLVLIEKMYGKETMISVKESIHYPHLHPKIEHQSVKIKFNDKLTILKKVLFKNDKKIGVLLQEGIDEFELASILDTYNRTFPQSINSISLGDISVKSKYNLTIIPTKLIDEMNVDEIHIPNTTLNTIINNKKLGEAEIINYNGMDQYIIEQCLERIEKQYGAKFKDVTKLLLDYN